MASFYFYTLSIFKGLFHLIDTMLQCFLPLGSHDIWHLVRVDILETVIAAGFLHLTLEFSVHLREWSEPYRGASGMPWKGEKNRKTDYFNAWVSGVCITISQAYSRPGSCLLDLKWSCSEATARSCGFPLTLTPSLMPWEPCSVIGLPCHLILLTSGFTMPVCANWFYFIFLDSCPNRGQRKINK